MTVMKGELDGSHCSLFGTSLSARALEGCMTAINNFIADLVRAANEIEKVGYREQRRLLERAAMTIRDMSGRIGVSIIAKGRDAVADLNNLVHIIDTTPIAPEEVRDGLLRAAGVIRDLHITLDTVARIRV
jgi:hypothetical protein